MLGEAELGKKVRFNHEKLLNARGRHPPRLGHPDRAVAQGRRDVDVALYVGNTREVRVVGTVELSGPPTLKCLLQSGELNVAPRKQQRVLYRFDVADVFLAAPVVRISYTRGDRPVAFGFSLPTTVLRFLQPKPQTTAAEHAALFQAAAPCVCETKSRA